MKVFPFKKTSTDKNIAVFTWDDNSATHYSLIAPLFDKYDLKCTFYINPGEINFRKLYLDGYRELVTKGYEIGSHGFTHHHFSSLPYEAFEQQLIKAKNEIQSKFDITPTTFAFPHHDFNEKMLQTARKYYFETRNTLFNSKRFSLKTASNIFNIKEAIDSAIIDQHTLVFSGHGLLDTNTLRVLGEYEPLPTEMLMKILSLLTDYRNVQILTFEQAALLTFLCQHCEICNNQAFITDNQLDFLRGFGIGAERISKLL